MSKPAAITSRTICTPADIDGLVKLLNSRDLPVTISIAKGMKRTNPQNKLQQLWCKDAAVQLEDRTASDVRGHCKLHYGVPILRAENAAFKIAYDKHIMHLPYATKLALMVEPFDFPVTRLMSARQKREYLDIMQRELTEWGVALTDPEALKYAT